MSDPLDKSGMIPANRLPPIPAFDEHEAEVARLWRTCRWLAIAIFIVVSLVTAAMFAAGMDPGKAVAISTIVFQAILLSYGMGFFVPAFLTSLKRLGLSVHMMYESLRLGRETTQDMRDLHDRGVPLFDRGNKLVEKIEPVVDKLDRAADDMRAIRKVIEREGAPVIPRSRPVQDDGS